MLRSSMYDYAVSFEGELITVSHLSEKFEVLKIVPIHILNI